MDDSSNSNYSSNYTLPSKRFEICRQLLRSFTLRLCETGLCIRRFESRLTTYKMLTLNSSKRTFFCGWYGNSFWPIWSFRVADVVVADMVCSRYGTDPQQCTNGVPIVNNSQKQSKDSQNNKNDHSCTNRHMSNKTVPTVYQSFVTCLPRLYQQCTNRQKQWKTVKRRSKQQKWRVKVKGLRDWG